MLYVSRMTKLVTTAHCAILVAVCGVAGAACGGGDGSSGPYNVQPQPIPDAELATRFEATAFTATTSSDGISIRGATSTGAPAGGGDQVGPSVAAIDLTTASAAVTVSADATGAFSVDLLGGSIGDRVLVYFPADVSLGTALEVPTASPADATSPCLEADGASGLTLGAIPVGTAADLAVLFSSSCGGAFAVDGIATVGDPVVTAPALGFIVPASGVSARETFVITPTSTARYLTFVILASGADRHVFALTGNGS